jgi:GTP pyrophosphokinase
MYSYEDEIKFQKAIIFASAAMTSCHNKKPVLVHSLRVEFSLYNMNYSMELVVSALLHDMVEDTSIKIIDIQTEFGEYTANLVGLLTMDEKINDYKEQYIANFKKAETSKDALIIRCADILDNMPYVKLAPLEVQERVRGKHVYFYQKSQEVLKNEPVWDKFQSEIAL